MIVERMRNRFLNAVWWFHRDRNSEKEDAEATKKVFELVKKGEFEKAAEMAKKNKTSREIWRRAINN